MLQPILSAIGFGIASIDPIGAALLLTAIAAKAGRTKVTAFVTSVFFGSVAVGVTLSFVGSEFIERAVTTFQNENSAAWAIVELVIAAIILDWLLRRKLKALRQEREPKKELAGSVGAYIFAGVSFVVASILDPTFLATLAVASRTGDFFTTVIMFIIWTLIGQVLLFGLFVLYLFGAHKKPIEFFRAFYRKHRRAFNVFIMTLGALASFFFILDAVYFFVSGSYLF